MKPLACLAYMAMVLSLPISRNKRQLLSGPGGSLVNASPALAAQQALARLSAQQISENVYKFQPADPSSTYSSAIVILTPKVPRAGGLASDLVQISQSISGLDAASVQPPASFNAPLPIMQPGATKSQQQDNKFMPALQNVTPERQIPTTSQSSNTTVQSRSPVRSISNKSILQKAVETDHTMILRRTEPIVALDPETASSRCGSGKTSATTRDQNFADQPAAQHKVNDALVMNSLFGEARGTSQISTALTTL